MKLLFANRKPRSYGNFSIESYFQTLSPMLAKEIEVRQWEAPKFSNGILERYLSVKALENEVARWCPDVTHITGDVHFMIWGIKRGKRVLTIHDIGFLREVRGLKYYLLRYFWLTGPIRRAHAITCVSLATKNEILQHLPQARAIDVIPTVIDPRFTRHDKPFNEARPTVLLLGSAPNKNLHRVLRATQGLNVHLSIIAKLDALALELLKGQSYEVCERIPFETLVGKYQAADILAMCSTHEGFGMPILEAQATGRVVLTSNCSSMPDVAGAGALLVNPHSVEHIREGLTRLLTDSSLRARLIEAGFTNTQRFLPEQVAQQYLALYKRLIFEKNA